MTINDIDINSIGAAILVAAFLTLLIWGYIYDQDK